MDKVSLKYNHGCLLIDCVLLSPVVKETKGSGEGSEHVADMLQKSKPIIIENS